MDVSVVIPCYNVARWLPACLDSVFAALPGNSEVFAVDDGSTDSTLAILRDRARAEPRLNVLSIPHAGVSAARNRALDRACGEYVFFVDPDDAVEPDFFSSMLEAMARDKADCCLCAYGERAEGSVDLRTVPLKNDYRYASNADIRADYLPRIFGYSFADVRAWYAGTPLFTRREMAYVWRMAFRRSVLETAHVRFDESLELNEDAMFIAEFLLSAGSLTSVNRPLYLTMPRADGAVRTLHRDGLRYCRNKLALLRKRDELDRRSGGELGKLFAGTNVLAALEILALTVRGRLPRAEGLKILRAYLATPSVARAVREFPLSGRHPGLMTAVLFLRLVVML